MKIDDKITLYYSPSPDAFPTVFLKAYTLSPVLTVFNSPYSLINRNFYATSATTKNKPKKTKITLDDKVSFHYHPAPDAFSIVFPKASA